MWRANQQTPCLCCFPPWLVTMLLVAWVCANMPKCAKVLLFQSCVILFLERERHANTGQTNWTVGGVKRASAWAQSRCDYTFLFPVKRRPLHFEHPAGGKATSDVVQHAKNYGNRDVRQWRHGLLSQNKAEGGSPPSHRGARDDKRSFLSTVLMCLSKAESKITPRFRETGRQ